MASTTKFFHVSVLIILLAITGKALSGRDVPSENTKDSKFLLKSDRSFLIPGAGRVYLPPNFSKIPPKKLPHLSFPSAGPARYIPGADGTLVPNPGFETPYPARENANP